MPDLAYAGTRGRLHMNETDRVIAQELRSRLWAVARLVDFRVFGSRARGTAGEDSDLDVFIEIEDVDRQTREAIDDVVWEVGFRRSVVISPFVVTRRELEESALRSSPVVASILRDGVRL